MPPGFCLTKYETADFDDRDFRDAYNDRLCVQHLIDEAGLIIYPESKSVDVLEKNLINIERGAVKLTSGYESGEYVSDFNQRMYDFMNTPKNVDQSYTASHRYPTIDIRVPDDILIKSFKVWVNKEREKLDVVALKSRVKVSSPAKLRNLHEARVLQYMDVSQYHQIMNKISGGDYQNKYGKTSDSEMVSIIFSDRKADEYYDDKDKMRVTKEYVKKLRDDKAYIAALCARP